MSLMLHFSVGNLWNTVYVFVCSRVSWFTSFTDIELIALMLNTFAISTVAMWSDVWGAPWCLYALWVTKAAALQFYKVEPLAGKLLALTLTWITAAAALTTRTWQLNPALTRESWSRSCRCAIPSGARSSWEL